MRFLIDECLHKTLVDIAQQRRHEATYVGWLGLGGAADWKLMSRVVDDDYTFVTNNARDFRRLFAKEELHAGLVIIVPQVVPARQREFFDALLDELAQEELGINEVIEIDGDAVVTRYALPEP